MAKTSHYNFISQMKFISTTNDVSSYFRFSKEQTWIQILKKIDYYRKTVFQ